MMKSLLLKALIRIRIMLKKPRPINRDIAAAIGMEKLPPIALMYRSGGKISPAEIYVSSSWVHAANEHVFVPAIDRPIPRMISAIFRA